MQNKQDSRSHGLLQPSVAGEISIEGAAGGCSFVGFTCLRA